MEEIYKKRQQELGEEKLNELKGKVKNLPEIITVWKDKETVLEAVYYGLLEDWH